MKRNKKFISMIVLIGIMIITGYIFRYKIDNQILLWIDGRLDYERSLESGDEFNKALWGVNFRINHYKDGNKLEYVNNNEKTVLLDSVINYQFHGNNMYVNATDGCAVVGGDNVARIYTEEGNNYLADNVIYLTSINDFNSEEKEVLKKLKQLFIIPEHS